jgi:uncharacterized repeat protein (TIGR03803 family)
MEILSSLARSALCAGAAVAILGGCGGSAEYANPTAQAPSPAGRAAAPHSAVTIKRNACPCYKVIYSFTNANDGREPNGLTLSQGTFYGTTYQGGTSGSGTVFSITATGTEKVLYSFAGSSDGEGPMAAPIVVNGVLYGTTYYGGVGTDCEADSGCGTVFSVTNGGTEKILHRFTNGRDGALPLAGLLDVHGKLFGTTSAGGGHSCGGGCGTVFTVTTSGTERIPYRFEERDGATPTAALINVDGTLYSTTFSGGAFGNGTVFRITTGGSEAVLHSFGGNGDGEYPEASLLYVDGALYSTTYGGPAPSGGLGTIFSITRGGAEKVRYTFLNNFHDGLNPSANLVELNGVLYGTTDGGGANGGGTIFSLTKNVKETVLYSFGANSSGPDGSQPFSGLTVLNGTLYGTTWAGGTYGEGTVFSYTP